MTPPTHERAAQDVRRDLGVGSGTLIDVREAIQRRGANLLLAPIAGGPEGCFGRVRGEAWIFANTVGIEQRGGWLDRSRLRFTLAHELGHMELGHGAKVDVEIEAGRSVQGDERQANLFAAELLVPVVGLRWYLDEMLQVANATTLDELVSIAGHFGVSCSVALYRLEHARRITGTYKRRLEEAIGEREHLTAERKLRLRSYPDSLKDLVGMESANRYRPPSAVSERVARAWTSGVLTAEAASGYLRISEGDFLGLMREMGIDEPDASAASDDGWW